MDESDVVSFDDVTVVQATSQALLVRIEDQEIWIPQSQISQDSEVYAEDTSGTLVISRWIAKQKKLV